MSLLYYNYPFDHVDYEYNTMNELFDCFDVYFG